MKSILNADVRNEVINRINSLTEDSQPQWGKMTVFQMLHHCVLAEELYLGHKQYKRVLLGRLFGKLALKGMLTDEVPMQRNAPTSKYFKVTGVGDIASEKQRLVQLVNEYANYDKDCVVHWFFGKMSKDQVGKFSYKHFDHHLRQFGV